MTRLVPYVLVAITVGLVWWGQVRDARERARRLLSSCLTGTARTWR